MGARFFYVACGNANVINMPTEQETAQPAEKDSNLFAALSYFLGPLVAVIIYLLKKEDRFVRFHALQSVVTSVALSLLSIVLIPVIWVIMIIGMGVGVAGAAAAKGGTGLAVFPLLWMGMMALIAIPSLIVLVIYILAAWNAFQGKIYKIPIVGAFVEKYV